MFSLCPHVLQDLDVTFYSFYKRLCQISTTFKVAVSHFVFYPCGALQPRCSLHLLIVQTIGDLLSLIFRFPGQILIGCSLNSRQHVWGYMLILFMNTVEPILKDHPILATKMWSVKTGGLSWQVQIYWNVGPSAKNVWSVKTGGFSWQWSLKTGFTV